MVKHKEVGLLVGHVMIKMDPNLVVGLMLLKVEKEGVDLLVPLVKHIKGGKGHELGKCIKN